MEQIEERLKPLSTRVPEKLLDSLKSSSRKTGVKMEAIVATALREYLAKRKAA